MIRFAWHDVLPTDAAILKGEFAGVRPSRAAERKIVEAGRRGVCNTFLFAGCGYVLRLIIAQDDAPKPGFLRRLGLAGAVRDLIARKSPEVDQPYSSAIVATAAALVPEALPELRRVAALRRCPTCTCVFRANGPTNPDSPQGRYLAAELAGSQFVKRNAA